MHRVSHMYWEKSNCFQYISNHLPSMHSMMKWGKGKKQTKDYLIWPTLVYQAFSEFSCLHQEFLFFSSATFSFGQCCWRVIFYEFYYFFLSSHILYGTAQELIWWKLNIWQCFYFFFHSLNSNCSYKIEHAIAWFCWFSFRISADVKMRRKQYRFLTYFFSLL